MMTDEKVLYFVKERLYDRRQGLLSDIEILKLEYKEIYNPHDFSSGEYKGIVDQMEDEISFIENLINSIENA